MMRTNVEYEHIRERKYLHPSIPSTKPSIFTPPQRRLRNTNLSPFNSGPNFAITLFPPALLALYGTPFVILTSSVSSTFATPEEMYVTCFPLPARRRGRNAFMADITVAAATRESGETRSAWTTCVVSILLVASLAERAGTSQAVAMTVWPRTERV
jgi:hypothetical protein